MIWGVDYVDTFSTLPTVRYHLLLLHQCKGIVRTGLQNSVTRLQNLSINFSSFVRGTVHMTRSNIERPFNICVIRSSHLIRKHVYYNPSVLSLHGFRWKLDLFSFLVLSNIFSLIILSFSSWTFNLGFFFNTGTVNVNWNCLFLIHIYMLIQYLVLSFEFKMNTGTANLQTSSICLIQAFQTSLNRCQDITVIKRIRKKHFVSQDGP